MKIYSYIKRLIKNQKRLADLDNRGWGLWWNGFTSGSKKEIERSNRIFNFVRGKNEH